MNAQPQAHQEALPRLPKQVIWRGWISPAMRSAGLTVLLVTASAASHAGGGGPIQGVVDGVNIVLATVTAICLALCTVGIGIAGYKIIFDGATFRDVSNKLLGSALAGSAGAVAGMFM